ncbi:MAG: hypothetical protein CL920_07425 [Deltaproteobacteria bacterium]|nr:hypothetical protein [Deltaproteobacteria bacterium]MBU48508.1 hypothetical protein [Deltaproteobacteria bacterium]
MIADMQDTTFYAHTRDGWTLQLIAYQAESKTKRPPVLCIHGFSQNHLSWNQGGFVRALCEEGFPVYLLDLRGHGGSQLDKQAPDVQERGFCWDLNDYLFEDLPCVVKLLRERHDGEKLLLCGHSLGGILSAVYTYRHPEDVAMFAMLAAPLDISKAAARVKLASWAMLRLRGLSTSKRISWKKLPMNVFFSGMEKVFFSEVPGVYRALPWLSRYDRFQLLSRLWNPHSIDEEIVRYLLRTMEAEPVSVVMQLADWAVQGGLRFGREEEVDYLPLLSQITTPHLGAWGDEDLLAPPRTADSFYRYIRGRQYRRILLKQTNHIDMTAGAPALYVANALTECVSTHFPIV